MASHVKGPNQNAAFGMFFLSAKSCKQKVEVLHPGPRSRSRKLQYIAELERTVNILQVISSCREIESRDGYGFQNCFSCSASSCFISGKQRLKQRAARMQREKQIIDGQHKSLRKEVERLKTYLAYAHGNEVRGKFQVKLFYGISKYRDNLANLGHGKS